MFTVYKHLSDGRMFEAPDGSVVKIGISGT